LVAAVIQAELLTTLQGPGPFTVFAPTDQAFADAGIDLAALDTPSGKATLSDILLYHVVSAEVPAKNVTDCMLADAANGQQLSFTVGDSVMVNDANVTLTDVISSNGLIHVIDKVLMPTDSPRDIPRTAQCTGIHDSLVAGVVQAELLETLQGPGPFTIFAPTDQAFIDAGIDLAALDTPEGKATLSDILLYHVVSGEVPAANVNECMSADAVNGQPLSFTVNGGVMVNDANVTLADVTTSNGVIHVIDKVLTPSDAPNDIPRTAQCTGIHDSLVAAVVQAELLETLQGAGPFTLFAPTDQAFTDAGIDLASLDTAEGKAILSDILLYHVVAGNVPSSAVTECMSANAVNGQPLSFTVDGGVMVNGANVTLADVSTSNGVIHVIDKVLTPTDTPTDIPRTAQCTGVHNSLVSAVVQAELLETLQGDGPFTVFAPTDQAFADAGIDLASLDNPEGKATLADILLYHVLDSEVPASAVTDCLSATTVNGNPLSFAVGDGVTVNGANVTATDVPNSNGIIHVIDKVLILLQHRTTSPVQHNVLVFTTRLLQQSFRPNSSKPCKGRAHSPSLHQLIKPSQMQELILLHLTQKKARLLSQTSCSTTLYLETYHLPMWESAVLQQPSMATPFPSELVMQSPSMEQQLPCLMLPQATVSFMSLTRC
jgi:uncharacterized surface protein with fasciclin (FAS1) repeats